MSTRVRCTPTSLLLIVVRAAFGATEFTDRGAHDAAVEAGLALDRRVVKPMLGELAEDTGFIEVRDAAWTRFACTTPPPRSLCVEAPATSGTSIAVVAVRDLRALVASGVDGAVRFEWDFQDGGGTCVNVSWMPAMPP